LFYSKRCTGFNVEPLHFPVLATILAQNQGENGKNTEVLFKPVYHLEQLPESPSGLFSSRCFNCLLID